MKCYTKCQLTKKCCKEKECRLWIDYPEDFNCTEIAVQKNDKLVFREVADRLHLTPSRIKQIESSALKKMNARINNVLNIL